MLTVVFNGLFGWVCVAAIFDAVAAQRLPPWSKSLPMNVKFRRVGWSLAAAAGAFALYELSKYLQRTAGLPYWTGALIFVALIFAAGFCALIIWLASLRSSR